MLHLGVNIDHVATLRQARYAGMLDSPNAEPVILAAAASREAAGAHGITVHLRADRRHIQDADVVRLREKLTAKLNLEMGNTPEILDIALEVKPDFVCLVPGAPAGGHHRGRAGCRGTARRPRVRQSIGCAAREPREHVHRPVARTNRGLHRIGAEIVELHTGTFANHTGEAQRAEIARLHAAADLGHTLGLQVNAGHGLTTSNIASPPVPHLVELNIGHHIVSRAVFTGLDAAVREMLAAMNG